MISKEGLDYERVEFSEIYHSVTEGPLKPLQAVLRDAGDLQNTLSDIPLPSVDFSKEQLIVVAPGEGPTSGYDVRITSVMYFTDRLNDRPPLTSIIYTSWEKGGPLDVVSRPIHIVRTRRLEGTVEFERNVER